jgi:hypothetical protein
MPDCDYCDAPFDDNRAYLDHQAAEHEGELGAIDQRRIADRGGDGSDFPTGIVVIVGVLGLAILLAGVGLTINDGSGGNGADGPTAVGSVHYHGSMVVSIEGQQLDFSRDRYQLQDQAFHYEAGDGTQWHVHAQRVTLQYALDTLGIEVTASTVTFDGTTYRDADPGTTVTVEVNGNAITPSSYELAGGDSVRVIVETNG